MPRRRKSKGNWREWLVYSKRERNGILVLLVILLACICLRIAVAIVPTSSADLSYQSRLEIAQWLTSKKTDNLNLVSQQIPDSKSNRKILFKFDPNEPNDSLWKMAGLSEKQIGSINKFILKGGNFNTIEDVKKMYCITPEIFSRIAPWIDLSDRITEPIHTREKMYDIEPVFIENKKVLVELNSADTNALKSIPGIGSYFAKNIVKYRDRLGGFFDIHQLLEVYKMTSEKIDEISPYIEIDHGNFHPFNINEATEKQLMAFPYLSTNQSKAIFAYRNAHGYFTSLDDLLKIVIIDEATLTKIRPYFTVD